MSHKGRPRRKITGRLNARLRLAIDASVTDDGAMSSEILTVLHGIVRDLELMAFDQIDDLKAELTKRRKRASRAVNDR